MAKIKIEISGPHNEKLHFHPLGQTVRGRFSIQHVAHRGLGDLGSLASKCPVIPGQQLWLDTESMVGVLYDPLGDPKNPEGQQAAKAIKAASNANHMLFGGRVEEFDEPKVHELDYDAAKNWAWAMVQAVLCKMAVLTSDSDPLPSVDDVRAMPGKRLTDPGNQNQRDRTDIYSDVVEVPKKKAAGRAIDMPSSVGGRAT